ncbi:GAG-pre-integrase domain-containing protein [Hirsutella rhossiliensis]|uniref:GAG-pre-integrase domain-containing protein n=1 Tax=Hirsutella rhossiliensis TaxID=111463 RepID=A0A9P8MM03_9HYPO|nr:GAG-pre-integrase domain-containing protein [Hirsutella rhossiliensis]KAH0957782.1 GAG-pre-integrase domain-containing protein [Hirsutella rhossiliensis]
MTLPDGSFQILRLKKGAYGPSFSTSLISFQTLRDEGIYWDTFSEPTRLVRRNQTIGILQRKYRQFVLEFRPTAEAETVNFDTVFQATKSRRAGTKDPRPASQGDGNLWHARLGHPGPLALHKLGLRNGVRIKGPKTVECEFCAQGKARKQISRRPPDRERNSPCHEIWIDWTDLSADHEDFVRVMFITDAFTGMVFPYFMRTYQEKHNWAVLRDFVHWMKDRYGFEVKIRSWKPHVIFEIELQESRLTKRACK